MSARIVMWLLAVASVLMVATVVWGCQNIPDPTPAPSPSPTQIDVTPPESPTPTPTHPPLLSPTSTEVPVTNGRG